MAGNTASDCIIAVNDTVTVTFWRVVSCLHLFFCTRLLILHLLKDAVLKRCKTWKLQTVPISNLPRANPSLRLAFATGARENIERRNTRLDVRDIPMEDETLFAKGGTIASDFNCNSTICVQYAPLGMRLCPPAPSAWELNPEHFHIQPWQTDHFSAKGCSKSCTVVRVECLQCGTCGLQTQIGRIPAYAAEAKRYQHSLSLLDHSSYYY